MAVVDLLVLYDIVDYIKQPRIYIRSLDHHGYQSGGRRTSDRLV
jgi:hypothetical protein